MKFISQHDQMDCGPACLAMIASHYGKNYTLSYLRKHSYLTREGVSLLGLSESAKKIGLDNFSASLTLVELDQINNTPCILHWNQNHFIVLLNISHKRKWLFGKKRSIYKIADPNHGILSLKEEALKKSWLTTDNKGIAFFVEPTERFYKEKPEVENKNTLKFIFNYVKHYKAELLQLMIGLLAGSLLTLIFPFLTQALIDDGIGNRSLHIVYIILLAQILIFVGASVIEIFRNWLLLYIGARINVTIISDFLKKIMTLPLRFFDTKMMGDFTQRINDHEKIEQLLTSQSLFTLFSFVNVSVFFLVLAYYNFKIVVIYFAFTAFAIMWAAFFLKARKNLDYQNFQKKAENQGAIYEILNGIQEIKLNDYDEYKRSAWEDIQVKMFKVNQRILRLDQYQSIGFNFINHLKNILVTFIAANEVINNKITLGAMLSISYIIGQINSPIAQLITFFKVLLEAHLSFNRLDEVHNHEEEEKSWQIDLPKAKAENTDRPGIRLQNIYFQYEGPKSPFILNDLSFLIPDGKITAITGASGSGKTTLMKILLKFYSPTNGIVSINGHDLEHISPKNWRKNCGTVMQDGYIFSDTIERNIVTGDKNIDKERVWHAVQAANLHDFIESLPLGLNTKIGASGNGISGGQKQRILIARAIYKNPKYLFFDEATSALDADNEKIIMKNLDHFFVGKTVVIIAHRLSTVKNAHQIIVLNKGQIVETGNHESLIKSKGNYFHLIKNQLELGA